MILTREESLSKVGAVVATPTKVVQGMSPLAPLTSSSMKNLTGDKKISMF